MPLELPSKETAEILEHLATAGGILFAGAWAFWRWSLSEFLRRRREIPSFDGTLTARSVPIDDMRDLLSVSCLWNNRSAMPLDVNTRTTRFVVYELPAPIIDGPVGPRMNNLVECFTRFSWEHWPSAVMEPGTSSELQAHFVLPASRPYIVMCRLEGTKKGQVWVRELIWESGHDREQALARNSSLERVCDGNT